MWKGWWPACLTLTPYWELDRRASPPNTLTTQTLPSGRRCTRWEWWAESGRDRLQQELTLFRFIHGQYKPPHTSCQMSVFMSVCVCVVHQVIVHEVPGQELEVEVYDKDPDQDDFLGRYLSTVHLPSVSSTFICVFPLTVSKCWFFSFDQMYNEILKYLPWPTQSSPVYPSTYLESHREFLLCLCRTTLDLGIVKKSMVVDDVSQKVEHFFFAVGGSQSSV